MVRKYIKNKISFQYINRLLNEYKPYFNSNRIKSSTPFTIKHYNYFLHYLLSEYPLAGTAKPWNIIELGCSYGLFVDFLNKLGYFNVIGIDIEREPIRIAKRFSVNAKLLDAREVSRFVGVDSFDLVFAINFFHKELLLKFKDSDGLDDWIFKTMSQCYRILKKGGSFFCDSEINLVLDKINKLGFKLKYCIPRHRLPDYQKQILVFEK